MSDEFYKVGGMIRDIFEKLENGIAIIALQKNRFADYWLGGERSVEKARLYLTMQPGELKIMKAKSWATSVNPNHMAIQFKLIGGCHFIETTDWAERKEGT